MSLDIGYETFIFVVMEVICGSIFGQGEVNWPPIDLKCLQFIYWSLYLSFDMSLDIGSFDMLLDISYDTFIFVFMEVIWGRIFGYS